jgi:hypothetical protein
LVELRIRWLPQAVLALSCSSFIEFCPWQPKKPAASRLLGQSLSPCQFSN